MEEYAREVDERELRRKKKLNTPFRFVISLRSRIKYRMIGKKINESGKKVDMTLKYGMPGVARLIWKTICKKRKFKNEMEKTLGEEDIDKINKKEMERTIKLKGSVINEYEKESSYDEGEDHYAELVWDHDEKPPSEEIPLCDRCNQNKSYYFTNCGHWFTFCDECYDDIYSHTYLPGICPECESPIDTIYTSFPEKRPTYKRANYHENLKAMLKEYKWNILSPNDNKKSSLCLESKCKNSAVYFISCCHLQDYCKNHTKKKELTLEESLDLFADEKDYCESCKTKQHKDFIIGNLHKCELITCKKKSFFSFNCGHSSRYCLKHTAENTEYENPYNISSICHICKCKNITIIPNPDELAKVEKEEEKIEDSEDEEF